MTDKLILGERPAWGQDAPVLLSCADRRSHVYVVGKSGTGKTTLLRNMILQDIAAGRGVGLIDPHGDLARDLLDHIPRRRTEDVVYFDPSDTEQPAGLNLLGYVPPERRHLVASGVVRAFKGIFPDFFGPRMEYVFNAAVLALLDCENVSLLCLPRMLSDEVYRASIVRRIKDPFVRWVWEIEFEKYDKKTQAEMVSPILNKVGQMFLSPPLRNALSQVKNRISARWIMDSGKIFIANLSKGKLGEHNANLIGALLVTQFELAAMSRADVPEEERRDFFLCVDEFGSFVSDSFASMLSESRKYGLCLTLAHQYRAQLKEGIEDAVTGNVGSIIAFRVGHEDAEAIEKAFGNTYPASEFTSLNNGEIYAKLLTNGRDVEPFHARTSPPQGKWRGRSEKIIKRSRERFSRPRGLIEHKIERWINSHR